MCELLQERVLLIYCIIERIIQRTCGTLVKTLHFQTFQPIFRAGGNLARCRKMRYNERILGAYTAVRRSFIAATIAEVTNAKATSDVHQVASRFELKES